jgi:quercetin dioxygenase-like cupin family protein
MKPLLCSAFLLLTFSLNAQAPVPLAHDDVPGEPHHHLKIENEYVRAYYVEVGPHSDTQLHQHDHDYLFVTLGATEVINAVLGKPEIKLSLKDGEARFTRGGFAHVARNLSDKPFRNVTIELLKAQGEVKNLCAHVAASAQAGDCPEFPTSSGGIHKKPLFETGKTSLDLVSLDPSLNALSLRKEGLIVFLGDTQIQDNAIDAPKEKAVEGDVIWVAAGSGKLIWNSKKKDLNFLLLTFSGAGSAAKPQ